MKFENKVVIITGSAQGLGESTAYRFANEGANVVVADFNYDKGSEVAKNIEKKYNVKSMAVKVDVTDTQSVKDMVTKTIEKFQKIDVLVCNAGITLSDHITDMPDDKWYKTLDVNLTGYFKCAREASKAMVKQGFGTIVQINSKSGKTGSLHNTAYSASKFGGIGLTQSLALDLAPYKIRVNSVCPGNLLDSPMWKDNLYDAYAKKLNIPKEEVRQVYVNKVPLRRGCTYEDVQNAVMFLASEEASYMTGQAINITGGQVAH